MTLSSFLNLYTLKEISQKTHISPVTLQHLFDKEFDTIPKNKFYGFIKIIQREFKVDLQELIDGYEAQTPISHQINEEEENSFLEEGSPIKESTPPKKNILLYFIITLIIVALTLIALIISNNLSNNHHTVPMEDTNTQISMESKKEILTPLKTDSSQLTTDKQPDLKEELSSTEKKEPLTQDDQEKKSELLNDEEESSSDLLDTTRVTELNDTVILQHSTDEGLKKLYVLPNELVWFKVYYLDDGNSQEFFTSNSVELNASKDQYIRFGHGNITIRYGDDMIPAFNKTLQPHFLLKKGILKKIERNKDYEK